ncbi:hypothetical protein J5751_03950 [bacterium]|nr:hypothetical protein [bacterium]
MRTIGIIKGIFDFFEKILPILFAVVISAFVLMFFVIRVAAYYEFAMLLTISYQVLTFLAVLFCISILIACIVDWINKS